MKVIIVEDEVPAAEKLERYLQKYDASIQVVARFDSVSTTVPWLRENQDSIDLIFMDIQLIDGLSFQIFQQVQVRRPVIFTSFLIVLAIYSFNVFSIEYILY